MRQLKRCRVVGFERFAVVVVRMAVLDGDERGQARRQLVPLLANVALELGA